MSNSIKTCCYRCNDRHLGCHDTCSKYQEFKNRREVILKKEKDHIRPIYNTNNGFGNKRMW